MREKEDRAFLRRVPGAEMLDLRLKDAPLRLRCGEDDVRNRVVNEADPAIAKITAALEKRVGPEKVDLLLLPLGLGHHVDHSTVRDAALSFAEALPCGFYEDAPFIAAANAEQEVAQIREQIAARSGWQLSPRTCHAGISASAMKRRLVQIYSSQIDGEEADQMGRWAEIHNGERIWVNDRMATMVDAGVKGWSEAPVTNPEQ